jgi:C-terminal processing protease CtpA/Prc
MAGVASGLALATTLMAMQVADSMSSRPCPYREARMPVQVDLRQDHGFLGIYYQFHDGYADVISVVPNTPAEQIGIRPGDHVLTIDHNRSRSGIEFQQRIFNSHSGASPELVVERRGDRMPTLRPTLAAWPSLISNAH